MAEDPRAALSGTDYEILESRFPSHQDPADHLELTLRQVQLLAEFAQNALELAELKGDEFRPGTVAAVLDSIRLATIDAQALADAARIRPF